MEIRTKVEDAVEKKYSIGKSDAKLVMVMPKPKELNAIRKRCTIKNRGSRGLGSTFNEEKFNKECMDKFIKGFINIKMDGKDLECNLENKILCDDNWSDFNECWNDVVMGAQDDDDLASEEELKNS